MGEGGAVGSGTSPRSASLRESTRRNTEGTSSHDGGGGGGMVYSASINSMSSRAESSKGGAAAAAAAAGDEDDEEGGGEKKQRFVWSPEVHQCFCDAVHHLGVDKAKPQAIAALMQSDASMGGGPNMPTRQNIKSHLQKYRLLVQKQV